MECAQCGDTVIDDHDEMMALRWRLAFARLCADMGISEPSGSPEEKCRALQQLIELRAVSTFARGWEVGMASRIGEWV